MNYFTGLSINYNEAWYRYGFSMAICVLYLSYPLFGLLADVWIGRNNAIHGGMGLCFISWSIGGIGYITSYYWHSKVLSTSLYIISYTFQLAGYATFSATIIQYNIDQLIGASAVELGTIIYWHVTAIPVVYIIFQLVSCFFGKKYFSLLSFVIPGVAITLVLVTHSFFKHKLENVSLINNPIKLTVRVLCYARKHKYPENRSALTYWEEDAPSRLDLGKRKYGGPFTVEEVEDVKTFFRMLPIFVAMAGYACSDDRSWISDDNIGVLSCLTLTGFWYYACSLVLTLLYLFVIRVFFHKFIPSMLKRISIGLFIALTAVLYNALTSYYLKHIKAGSYSNALLLAPQLLHGLSFILLYPVLLEFTIAQSPIQMRGVMIGFWHSSWNIGYIIATVVKIFFNCQGQPYCTDFYYYLTKSAIVLIILISFLILAKRYKYRVRENEVKIVQIIDDHYQRYMDQEEEHFKAIGIECLSAST